MATHRLYRDDLSADEARIGFIRAFVNNPDAGYQGQPSFVLAVIYQLRTGSLIIKSVNLTGDIIFQHRVFGTYEGRETAEWIPVFKPCSNALDAINAVHDGVYQTEPEATTVRLATDRLAIPLRCPFCSHEFSVADDHLPVEGRQTCPSCGKDGQTDDFNAYNI